MEGLIFAVCCLTGVAGIQAFYLHWLEVRVRKLEEKKCKGCKSE